MPNIGPTPQRRSISASARPPFILPLGRLAFGSSPGVRVILDPSLRLLTYGSVAAITKESRLIGRERQGRASTMAGQANFDRARMLGHYRTMARIRAFEEAAEQALKDGH